MFIHGGFSIAMLVFREIIPNLCVCVNFKFVFLNIQGKETETTIFGGGRYSECIETLMWGPTQ